MYKWCGHGLDGFQSRSIRKKKRKKKVDIIKQGMDLAGGAGWS